MKILFLDVETTGLDPTIHRVVEIGASLFCSDENRLLRSICFITNDDSIEISPEITAINKISQSTIDNHGVDFKSVFPLLTDNFVTKADFLCGHNSPFDRAFIESELKRLGMSAWPTPWIDTAVDIPYPQNIQTRKLTHLAAEHEFLNPFPHTALSDVLTTYRIFSEYNISDILERQASPTIWVQALVDYANREKASKRGYRWNATQKKWLRQIKTFELEREKKAVEFEVEVQNGKP